MRGPAYVVVADDEWMGVLQQEKVESFYHRARHPKWWREWFHPRGYSRFDGESGATTGDLVCVKNGVHVAAKRAYNALEARKEPNRKDMDALRLVVHEYAHCMVRVDEHGVPLKYDLQHYSHPDSFWAAFWHAVDHAYPINAFTGFLRRSNRPHDVFKQGLDWFGAVLADRGE